MRFRILGPLEVESAQGPVPLGGPKPRALLAALLLEPGRVVSTDRLVAALWGDRPPPGAVGALRAYTSRLRTALGSAERLVHRAPGYVLVLDGAEVDAAEFERLLALARAATAADDHPGALAALDAGLRLWRGEALAEFADHEFAATEAQRLATLRLAALEERAAALVALGRADEAVPDLDALVRRHPARERPAVELMRALYAVGRQADALAAYHALRRRLDDELGVEPGEPARELYQRILVHDPELAARAAGNLPRAVTGLVGRDGPVADARAALAGAPLVTLTGVGGVGKSRLALEVAGRERDRFRDGAWLVELAALPDSGPVGHALTAVLGVQQRHGHSIDRSLVEYLRSRALLIVLDNCEHVLGPAARLVAEIVRHCPEVAVLATSRERLGVDGEQVRPVPSLDVADATALFVERARAARPDFALDPAAAQAVAAICARLDGLPLGIELAAARMRAMTPVEVAERLAGGRLLGGGPGPQPRHQSLTAAVDWSYRLLAPAEQELFPRLSVFAGGCDADAVHGVCAPHADPDDTLDLLTRLVDRSMVVATRRGGRSRYRVLETLRAYGRGLLAADGEPAGAHARYYTALAERAARGLHGADERAWVERVLPDHDNLRAAFEHAHTTGATDLALRLVTAAAELGHLRIGYETASWAERALDLAGPGHPLHAATVGVAARGAWNRGEFARARALVARAEGRVPGRGTARIAHPGDVRADVDLYEGHVAAALGHYTAEAARARTDGDPIRLVWTLYYVAVCHAVRRAPGDGMAAAQESLRVAEATGNPTALSMARYALGLVLKKVEPQRALALFDEAGELAASVRNFWWFGIARMEAAATRAVHGDPHAAARAFVAVLDHWDRVGDHTQQWLNLRYIVRLLARVAADDDADALHRALLAAGKPSPLGPDTGHAPTGHPADPAAAVARARTALARLA